MARIRVYQLAEKWKVDKIALLKELSQRGVAAKSLLSQVEETELNFTASDLPAGKPKRSFRKAEPLENDKAPLPASPSTSAPGSLVGGISLVVAVIASCIALSAFFQMKVLHANQKQSLKDQEANSRRVEKISRDLFEKLVEQENQMLDLVRESSQRVERERTLRQLRAQAEILREIAGKVPGTDPARLEEIQKNVAALLRETDYETVGKPRL